MYLSVIQIAGPFDAGRRRHHSFSICLCTHPTRQLDPGGIHLQLKIAFFGYQNENHLLREDLMDFNHLALRDINIDMEEIVYSERTAPNQVVLADHLGFPFTTLQSAFFFSGTKTIQRIAAETAQQQDHR